MTKQRGDVKLILYLRTSNEGNKEEKGYLRDIEKICQKKRVKITKAQAGADPTCIVKEIPMEYHAAHIDKRRAASWQLAGSKT